MDDCQRTLERSSQCPPFDTPPKTQMENNQFVCTNCGPRNYCFAPHHLSHKVPDSFPVPRNDVTVKVAGYAGKNAKKKKTNK